MSTGGALLSAALGFFGMAAKVSELLQMPAREKRRPRVATSATFMLSWVARD